MTQISHLANREIFLTKENNRIKELNTNLMNSLENVQNKLTEERKNTNMLQFETQNLVTNLEKANERAKRAEGCLD